MQNQKLRTLMLPVAMIGGAVFYPWMDYLTFLSPYLIFLMLFVTYCRLDFRHIRLERFQLAILSAQMLIAAASYFIILPLSHTVAEGVFLCVFIPTATAAPVITSILGGSIAKVATLSLLGNLLTSIAAPLILAAIGDNHLPYIRSFLMILSNVMPLLVLPIGASLVLKFVAPSIHRRVVEHQSLSFYMWAVSLFIIVGSCVSFTINHFHPEQLPEMIGLALGALAVCLIQFRVGRRIGGRYGDKVAGGQGLAQKNTVLAVWLALAYMNPVASLAPAAYIAWQNMINSWQIMRMKENPIDDSRA